MWTRIHSKIFQGVNREEIWRIWTDVNNWPKWHDDLEYCTLDGDFAVGNHFMLKPHKVKAVKIVLTDIKEGYHFTDCTRFYGAQMYDTHSMEETVEGLKLTNKLVVCGPLKWLWIKLVAQDVADSVPKEMDRLIQLAKERYV